MSYFKVAIDGPAGSGKSTISKLLAKKSGFVHVDTGAMYRACTLACLNKQIDFSNEESYYFLENVDVTYDHDIILLDGKDVSKEIRSKEVTDNVSKVASQVFVRDLMVKVQQKIAQNMNVIMDGRDIGTVVLKDADLKIFLDASVDVRAKRRYDENNNGMTLEELKQDIIRRDYLDSTRDYNPLVKASDAILIDTSNLTIEEVVNKINDLIEEIKNGK